MIFVWNPEKDPMEKSLKKINHVEKEIGIL